MKTGIELIAQERKEQIEKHGYTKEFDQENDYNELPRAAVSIIDCEHKNAKNWPWNNKERYFKIVNKSRIEQLAIAGALVAAEIDRLQSLKQSNQ